ncbi:MAG: lanthionine synthetase C family protein [Kofleriaceae bacterium]
MTMSWRPILEGEAAAQAIRVAGEIAHELVAACTPVGPPDPREAIVDRGDAGLALACAYLYRAGLLDSGDAAGELLDRALVAVAEHEMDHTLLRGFTGIGWVANHIIGDPEDDPVEAIDEALLALLVEGPPLHFDLIQGLVGIGTYALARMPRASAHRILELVVGRLARAAEHTAAGITWFTSPDAPGGDPIAYPRGSYALGFARGVPGVTALVAAAHRHGIAGATELVDGSVAWLLAQQIDTPAARFPIQIVAGSPPITARPAWCFGDIGVALGLAIAAGARDRADWRQIAIETARLSATSPLGDHEIHDAGICHGSAGLAHLVNRIYQLTGDGELRRGAVRWYERALAMRRPADGYAGFAPAVAPGVLDASGRAGWSLVFGAAGVSLCLLSAATSLEPAWDQLLLVDMIAVGEFG